MDGNESLNMTAGSMHAMRESLFAKQTVRWESMP